MRLRLIIAGMLGLAAGCGSMGHGATPQQQFADALRHGNGTAASSIWLHMSADDRANWSHGVGSNRAPSADEVKMELLQNASTSNGGSPGTFSMGDQTIEIPAMNTASAELQNLPALSSVPSGQSSP